MLGEVLGVERRRRWSEDEKLEILSEVGVGGASVTRRSRSATRSRVPSDLPPEAPSFITRVCGSGFHILRFGFGQARRERSPQIAQAPGARRTGFCCRGTSAA